jgi:hypothetical protein
VHYEALGNWIRQAEADGRDRTDRPTREMLEGIGVRVRWRRGRAYGTTRNVRMRDAGRLDNAGLSG